MRRLAPLSLIAAAALAGCANAEKRCADISFQQLKHELDSDARDRFSKDVQDSVIKLMNLPGWSSASPAAFTDSSLALRRRMSITRPGGVYEPEVTPPPRPSDVAWSAENCFEGKAR